LLSLLSPVLLLLIMLWLLSIILKDEWCVPIC
jgi:hypothetical protein